MSHPLLTKVLAEAYAIEFPPTHVPGLIDRADQLRQQRTFMDRIAAAISPDIADRLERALDVCQDCGVEHAVHFPGTLGHPFVPLVQP